MDLKVVAGAVSVPDAFDPACTHVNLGVPAVASVVRHFCFEVLPEPELFRNYADLV